MSEPYAHARRSSGQQIRPQATGNSRKLDFIPCLFPRAEIKVMRDGPIGMQMSDSLCKCLIGYTNDASCTAC